MTETTREASFFLTSRFKDSVFNYEPCEVIGKGAFGEVRICKNKLNGEVVAIKKLSKEVMKKKNQILHLRTEREVMISNNSQWLVSLKSSFQDSKFLYLVMDFLPGGDFMSLLIKKDIIPEKDSKLYFAEMVMGIADIHEMGCIHRDIKPDNILIDKNGHIKFADFGLSKMKEENFFPISANKAEEAANAEVDRYALNRRHIQKET